MASSGGARVAILGAGAMGCATAAHAQALGASVAMWSPTARRLTRTSNLRAEFRCTGALRELVEVDLLPELSAVADFPVVIVCLPGYAYEAVLSQVAGHWLGGQTLVISGALSLSPLWVLEQAHARGQSLQVAGWGTTLTTAHFLPDGSLHVNAMRERIDMAALGATAGESAAALCNRLFGERFQEASTLLAPALANINPIAHAAEVIPNLSRVDQGERWPLFGCFTKVVARLAERLDGERLALAQAFGVALPTLAEHYHRSYQVPLGPLEAIAQEIEARGLGPLGPDRLEHRYLSEDVPYGLVFQEVLARQAGVPTPALSAAITVLEIAAARDFRGQNFLISELALDREDVTALRKRCAGAVRLQSPASPFPA